MRKAVCRFAERLARSRPDSCSRFRLIAVIARGSRIITHGCNSNKSPGVYPASVHAEAAAIRQIQFRYDLLNGSDMYVVRVLANGSPAMAKPCPACHALIAASGIDTVHYTDPSGNWVSMEIVHAGG